MLTLTLTLTLPRVRVRVRVEVEVESGAKPQGKVFEVFEVRWAFMRKVSPAFCRLASPMERGWDGGMEGGDGWDGMDGWDGG